MNAALVESALLCQVLTITIALPQMVLTQNTFSRLHHLKKAVSEYYKITIMKKKVISLLLIYLFQYCLCKSHTSATKNAPRKRGQLLKLSTVSEVKRKKPELSFYPAQILHQRLHYLSFHDRNKTASVSLPAGSKHTKIPGSRELTWQHTQPQAQRTLIQIRGFNSLSTYTFCKCMKK